MENDAKSWFWLCCILCAISTSWSIRKYDVEHEAMKLYKEDIRTVLHRFRRTADYLKIIDASLQRFLLHTENLAMATLFHFNKKLEEKVEEVIVRDKKTTADDTIPDSSSAKNFARRLGGSHQDDENRHIDNQKQVDLLDRYTKLASELTVAQKNEMKNLGFTYAGEVIHKIIQNLREVDEEQGESTKGPEEDGNTPHVKRHEVTVNDEEKTSQPVEGDGAASPDLLRTGDLVNVITPKNPANPYNFRAKYNETTTKHI